MTGVVAPPRPTRTGEQTAEHVPHDDPPRRSTPWPRSARFGLAATVYLCLAVALWWNVWSVSPSGVMTCDCTDAGRMMWYLEWIPFALGHGHALLHSTYLFHPQGFNLLDDTSIPLIGFLASPVTTIWGPVVAANVVSTLVPPATALAMYWLLLRWVRWAPAAFVGGLAYGFSAWVVVQLSFGWINLACVALLPLIAGTLDELLCRQRGRALPMGVLLAVLIALEFFVSVEMSLLVLLAIAILLVLVVAGAAIAARDAFRRRWRHAATGLVSGAVATGVILAYPAWYLLAGPSHLSGPVWAQNVPGSIGNTVGDLWNSIGYWGSISSVYLARLAHYDGGFAGGPLPSPSLLGWGFLAVLAAGLVLWRADRRLWVLFGVGAATFALSLQVGSHRFGPWSLLYHLPLLVQSQQYRLAGIFVLCAAGMLGIVVDRTHGWSYAALDSWRSRPHSSVSRWWTGSILAGTGAVAVAAVALVPTISELAPDLPVPMQRVTVPIWFTTTATRLPAGTVLATYPFPTASSQASIPWQAITGMPYEMAGGGGPAGAPQRAGPDRRGFQVLLQASAATFPPPELSAGNVAAVRTALRNWGVTTVVVPEDAGLEHFLTGRGTAYGVAFYTSVLGEAPLRQQGAWVWPDIGRDVAPTVPISAATLASCVAQAPVPAPLSAPWARCILAAART